MKYIFTALLILSFSTSSQAKQHDWKTCKIISQEVTSYASGAAAIPMGTLAVAMPIYRKNNQVVIETNGYRYTLVEKPSRHYIILPQNGNAQFYQDGNWYVFLDIKGKEHKFSVEGMEVLDKQSQK